MVDFTKDDYQEKTLKKVMDFLKGQIFDEEFDILSLQKYGGCRIEENETAKQIFDRIERKLDEYSSTKT